MKYYKYFVVILIVIILLCCLTACAQQIFWQSEVYGKVIAIDNQTNYGSASLDTPNKGIILDNGEIVGIPAPVEVKIGYKYKFIFQNSNYWATPRFIKLEYITN